MTSYSIRVNLHEKWQKQWSSVPDMKLCFAMEFSNGGDKTYHNVVACTNDIAPSTQISWTDKYKIAARLLTDSGEIIASTAPIDVKVGTKTNVPKTGFLSTGFSSDAPSNGFLFTNEVECSAVLFCEIDGHFVPVYTSHAGKMSPGSSEQIIPKNKVYVWFSDDAKSATMTETMGPAKEIEINHLGEKIVTFDEEGKWTGPGP